jgi:hypothetical protein
VLLRLARVYENRPKELHRRGRGTGTEDLAEIFADPMFSDIAIPRYELLEIADNAPSAADAIRASTRRWWSGGTRRRVSRPKPRPRT